MLELELSSSPSTISTPAPILFYPSSSSGSPRLLLPPLRARAPIPFPKSPSLCLRPSRLRVDDHPRHIDLIGDLGSAASRFGAPIHWCSLAHYIHEMDLENAKRKVVEGLFFPLFSALLDALLLHAQVAASDGDNGVLYIPDGLLHFRMNLEEFLTDICQLLGSATFVQKEIKLSFNTTSCISPPLLTVNLLKHLPWLRYKNDPEIPAMTNLIAAYQKMRLWNLKRS